MEFENRVLRRLLGHRTDEVTASRENYIMRSFISFNVQLRDILLILTC
jgi:hypothetical protein